MIKIWHSFLNLFYGTFIGGLYFDFLLWLDRTTDKPSRYLTPKEMAQVIRQYSMLNEGVNQVKRKVNTLINSKSKEEYEKVLSELENMVEFAERDSNTPQAQFSNMLRQMAVKKGNQDIVTMTDKAKMVEKRIDDMYELQEYTLKRRLIQQIRAAKTEGNTELANKLQEEFNTKYGRQYSRH